MFRCYTSQAEVRVGIHQPRIFHWVRENTVVPIQGIGTYNSIALTQRFVFSFSKILRV